jgi:hypothetical protein
MHYALLAPGSWGFARGWLLADGWWAAGCGLWAAGCGLRAVGCGLYAVLSVLCVLTWQTSNIPRARTRRGTPLSHETRNTKPRLAATSGYLVYVSLRLLCPMSSKTTSRSAATTTTTTHYTYWQILEYLGTEIRDAARHPAHMLMPDPPAKCNE